MKTTLMKATLVKSAVNAATQGAPKRKRPSKTRYASRLFRDPTLYVVANRTDAVFFLDGRDHKFHFFARLANPEGQLIEQKLDSDKPGRGVSSSGAGVIHHGLDRRFTRHEQAARVFARKIAAELEAARRLKRFDDLVLAAEPHFLGLLRAALPARTRAAIRHEVTHDYAQGSDEKVRRLIMKAIAAEP